MAIANRIYPEHLGEAFCDSYEAFYKERGNYAKGTGENLAIKLGLNATYGNSNSKYSPFYDPKYTMSITINGQLSLCMLMERLIAVCGVQLIQANTDGFTVKVKKDMIERMKEHVSRWEKVTGLTMESANYSKMFVADVNNYFAIYTNGKVKMKGRYEYQPQLSMDLTHAHKNHSSLVVQMAVEHELMGRGSASEFIHKHDNIYDFMLRTKVDRTSRLILVNGENVEEQQRICRYYASLNGGKLIKVMPALSSDSEERMIGIDASYNIKTCNNIDNFENDIDMQYYIDEADKLLEPFKEYLYN